MRWQLTISRCWRYLWAAPATLLGAALALPMALSGAQVQRVSGVWEVTGGRLVERWFGSRWRPAYVAIVFGHVILAVSRPTLAPLRGHEHVHVRQYERWGLLFFPLYGLSSLYALLRGGDPYRDNHFEREAFAADDFGYDETRLS